MVFGPTLTALLRKRKIIKENVHIYPRYIGAECFHCSLFTMPKISFVCVCLCMQFCNNNENNCARHVDFKDNTF